MSQQILEGLSWHLVHIPLRRNCNNVGDPLNFHLIPTSGPHFNLPNILVYDQIPAKLPNISLSCALYLVVISNIALLTSLIRMENMVNIIIHYYSSSTYPHTTVRMVSCENAHTMVGIISNKCVPNEWCYVLYVKLRRSLVKLGKEKWWRHTIKCLQVHLVSHGSEHQSPRTKSHVLWPIATLPAWAVCLFRGTSCVVFYFCRWC